MTVPRPARTPPGVIAETFAMKPIIYAGTTHSISGARHAVQDDIEVYTRAIMDLKKQLNTLTPIGILPPELLSEVFVCIAADAYFSNLTASRCRLDWIALAHVCHHWRAVALNTSRLWSYLRLFKKELLSEFLARSKTSPLYVSAALENRMFYTRKGSLDIVAQHWRRLRQLRLHAPLRTIQEFCGNAPANVDALDELILISANTSHDHSQTSPARPILVYAGRASRLRHLELHRMPFHWSDPLFSSPSLISLTVAGAPASRTLILTDEPPPRRPDVGSFTQLLTVLDGISPRLRYLHLGSAIPHDRASTAAVSPTSFKVPIVFPSLETLRLVGPAPEMTDLLDCISIPLTTKISFIGEGFDGFDKLLHQFSMHVSRGSPPLCIRTMAYTSSFTIYGWTDSHPSPQGDAPFQLALGRLSTGTMTLSLEHAGALFTHLQRLDISGYEAMTPGWTDVFRRVPNLRELHIDEPPSEDFLLTLATAPESAREPGRGGTPASVLLPHLCVLALVRFDFGKRRDRFRAFNALLDWAIFRCNHGVPIEQLRLDRCVHATKALVGRLGEVVVNVRWDWSETDSEEDSEDEDSNTWNSESSEGEPDYDDEDEDEDDESRDQEDNVGGYNQSS
ncbi:hypothetical protein BD413DRAFT_148193 [Trametes elegans]|nr:hypothetical protein BD413DRAFT_148193 [Trametes elegans]